MISSCYIIHQRCVGCIRNIHHAKGFIIEFVKEEQVAFEKGMTLDMGQWLSVPMIIAGVVIVILSHKGLLKEGIFTSDKKNKK